MIRCSVGGHDDDVIVASGVTHTESSIKDNDTITFDGVIVKVDGGASAPIALNNINLA